LSINAATGALVPISGSPFPLSDPRMIPLTYAPSGKFLYVPSCGSTPNLGCTGGISTYAVDPSSGILNISPTSSVSGTFGALDFIDPSGRIFLSMGDSQIGPSTSNYTLDPTSGAMTMVPGSPMPLVNLSAPTWLNYQTSTIVKVP